MRVEDFDFFEAGASFVLVSGIGLAFGVWGLGFRVEVSGFGV